MFNGPLVISSLETSVFTLKTGGLKDEVPGWLARDQPSRELSENLGGEYTKYFG